MNQKKEKTVLCGASAYTEKYYLNEEFQALPDAIKDVKYYTFGDNKNELKIMCVLYTNDVGGVLTLEFDEDGELCFHTEAQENDFSYDEIGSVLKIRELQRSKAELLESLELYYKVVILGMDASALAMEEE